MRTLLLSAATALVPLALIVPSSALAGDVTFSPLDLARGELYLSDDVAIEDTESLAIEVVGSPGRCDVAGSGNIIYNTGPGTCPALWAMPEVKELSLKVPSGGTKVTVKLTPAASPGAAPLMLNGNAIALPASVPEVPEIAILVWEGAPPKPSQWEYRPVENRLVQLDAVTVAAVKQAAGRYLAFAYDPTSEEGGALVFPVATGATAATPTPAPNTNTTAPRPPPVAVQPDLGNEPPGVPMTIDPAPPEGEFTLQAFPPGEPIPAELKCPPKRLPQDDMIVICVDATGPTMRYWQSPRTRFTKPNYPFYVHVVHRIEHRVQIGMDGTAGSHAPGSRGRFVLSQRAPGEGFNLEGESETTPVTYVATGRTFAPRHPGVVKLEVRLLDTGGLQIADPFKLEFVVDETYSGAFRVGVAGILLGALDQRYRGETRPGSTQPEIVATGVSVMDLDVVLGYSPYLDSGGRPANGCEYAPFCFNPYFGLGLLSASGNGDLQWLKSVHLGVEWELTEAFAIGVTANLRRVERLAKGLRPGYPIEGAVPTDDKFVFGVGLVINLSPEFLRIGASGAKAVLN